MFVPKTKKVWVRSALIVATVIQSRTVFVIVGDTCKVRDPRTGYEFDLSSLKDKDYQVTNGKYTYHLSVCVGLKGEVCNHVDVNKSVSSCQADGANMKIGGRKTTKQKLFCFNLLLIFCMY